ncbi:biopolymer transporter ExbD [Methylomonas sp. LWB]|uniref:ExbD/TolR family protein n=1 Tax=Methylomonas sp. LWB TaxID=1905845 RepID=UPI0008D9DD12|nr:biopolymer transporter ExbD [Methylomonas sp. LWB]OHX36367.1 biopolymer transporter ExbD [Methylomonas sp. LWB]
MGFKAQARDDDAVAEINVTPLVDVMLVLVIILLVTAPLLTQSMQAALPKNAQSEAVIEKPPLELAIEADGAIRLNKQFVADLDALQASLQRTYSENPEQTVHLSADHGVHYGRVAQVMAAVKHAGIVKLALVTVEP